jgi:hypothetical protein
VTPPTHPLSRREFLRAGAATAVAAAAPLSLRAAPTATADACIFLMLTGGPSQLDTFDPKPNAPSDIRGPFSSIRSAVPGLHLSELFPRMAAMADKFSLVRAMNHQAAPIHETGFQLLNTGKLFRDGPTWPNVGAVVSYLLGAKCAGLPPSFITGRRDVNTGINVSHGQDGGFLGQRFSPVGIDDVSSRLAPASVGWLSGMYSYAESGEESAFWLPRRFVELGVRHVTVNMFSTVFDAPSWDCHADRGSLSTDLDDYRDTVAPAFDVAFSQLLSDLDIRGLLARTLVVATGEFGRTPHPNANGGRDHWPGCWTTILAGGGVQGGRVVGSSDAIASEPKDRPVTPAELVATIYHALGISPHATIPGPDGSPVRVIEASPVTELF